MLNAETVCPKVHCLEQNTHLSDMLTIPERKLYIHATQSNLQLTKCIITPKCVTKAPVKLITMTDRRHRVTYHAPV